jgi:TetR/AcrR family transcriptional repressor of nem operon
MGRPRQFDEDVAISAAMELFWRKGYGATTPAELTDALGVGKGSFYNAFGSKHALFEQALRRYGDERVARLTAILTQPGPVRKRLQAALERLATTSNRHLRHRGCLATNTAAELGGLDHSASEIVRSIFDRIERALQSTIEEGQRNGEIDVDRDAQDVASLLLTTIVGMAVMAKTADRGGRLRRVIAALMASF